MNNKSKLIKSLSVFCVLCSFVAVAFGAKALTAQEKLEKGQSLFEAGDYDKAMDNFLDVFVEGNIEQINIANEYVNMIHFKRGGVSTPIRVTYDEELEAQKEAYKQEAKDIQEEMAKDYEKSKDYIVDSANAAQSDVQARVEAEQQKALALKEQEEAKLSQAQAKLEEEQQQALTLKEQEEARILAEQEKLKQELQEAQAEIDKELSAMQNSLVVVVPEEENAEEYSFVEGSSEELQPDEVIVSDETQYTVAQRDQKIDQNVEEMQKTLIDRLNKQEGVNVYMRNGKVDAIDIDSDVIFLDDKITFSSHGKEVLEDVYALMLLSKDPVFVLLPPGSYTDEVALQGMRQAVALNSYLINMGLSSSKLNFNMGLLNEQPPAKFSNLEGISIVFDYDKKPSLYNKVSDKRSYPILSLGMYPEKINTTLGEMMVIDYSVIETAYPIADWKLQIIQHASDGKYYIVRQVSGKDSVYDQIYWNGKKQFFGAALPDGKYTLMLRAKDNKGKEKIVRRKVELVSVKEKVQETKTSKTAKTSKTVKQAALDYSTPRLWKKPARVLKKQNAVHQETIDISETVSVENSSSVNQVNQTTTTTTTTVTTQTTQSGVVNPSASPDQNAGAYDSSLEDLL